MTEKPEKVITKENLKTKMALLDLDETLQDEMKFRTILQYCDENLGKFLIEEKISSWSLLNKQLPSKNDFADKILTICTLKKEQKETKSDYIKRIYNELLNYGCSESKIIKFLSDKLWPTNILRSLELSRNTTIVDLLNHVQILVSNDVIRLEKKKFFCTKCKRNGHLESNCTVRN